jgi:hypothetical protein
MELEFFPPAPYIFIWSWNFFRRLHIFLYGARIFSAGFLFFYMKPGLQAKHLPKGLHANDWGAINGWMGRCSTLLFSTKAERIGWEQDELCRRLTFYAVDLNFRFP